MGRTKKAGSTGRFGPRYGLSIRRRVLIVEREQKVKHQCPSCKKYLLKRQSRGIYYCKSCGASITGRAYTPK